jgi:hypothetical protein
MRHIVWDINIFLLNYTVKTERDYYLYNIVYISYRKELTQNAQIIANRWM